MREFNQQGNLNFSGSSNAGVNNQGTINGSMGDVYLIAAQVNKQRVDHGSACKECRG